MGISGQFNGKSYHKSKWTSEGVGNKDIYAESSLTSLTVSISCGRTAAQYNQTLTGTVSVDAGNYIVSYNANGGIGAPTSQTKEHNKTLTTGDYTIVVETLASAIGEDIDTIEDVYEPYLMQMGFLNRTPRGRTATVEAYKHLGIAVDTGSRYEQMNLEDE